MTIAQDSYARSEHAFEDIVWSIDDGEQENWTAETPAAYHI